MPTTVRIKRPDAVLWDMDGTLIDQTRAIVRCYCEIINNMGLPAPQPQAILRSLGGPMASTMRLFIPDGQVDEACSQFRLRFPEIMFDGLILLAGGEALIQRFQQAEIPQAILTNKHGKTARRISQHSGFDQHIAVCVGNSDTEWSKPQAELTHHVLQRMNVTTSGACIIGDSPTDIETAHNAGLPCYGVATGAHCVAELLEARAEAAFENLNELSAAFCQL
jgi:phosphoglycolate phosphatase